MAPVFSVKSFRKTSDTYRQDVDEYVEKQKQELKEKGAMKIEIVIDDSDENYCDVMITYVL